MFSGLDPASALHLVQANLMNKETLQKSLSLKAWKQIVAGSKDKYGLLKKEDVRCLVEILKLAKMKEQSKYILALLDLICDMPVLSRFCCPDYVKLICPNHPKDMSNSKRETPKTVHFVTPIHFYLLEEIEGAFGTTEQILASTDIPNLREPVISALASRLSRQREQSHDKVRLSEHHQHPTKVFIDHKIEAEAFTSLLLEEDIEASLLEVFGTLEEEVWRCMAKALKEKPSHKLRVVFVTKEGFANLTKDIFKDIWDVAEVGFCFISFSSDDSDEERADRDKKWVTKDEIEWEAAWTSLKDEYESRVIGIPKREGGKRQVQTSSSDDSSEEEDEASAKPPVDNDEMSSGTENGSEDKSSDEDPDHAFKAAGAPTKVEESSSDESSEDEKFPVKKVKVVQSSSEESSSEEEEP